MAADPSTNVHATAISAAGRAVLIAGPSGSGKSDLALRCLAMTPMDGSSRFELVSDDRCIIRRDGDLLLVNAPQTIAGRLEVRGVGVIMLPHVEDARVVLVAELETGTLAIERMPDAADYVDFLGVRVPKLRLRPFEPSAPLKLMLALRPEIGLATP